MPTKLAKAKPKRRRRSSAIGAACFTHKPAVCEALERAAALGMKIEACALHAGLSPQALYAKRSQAYKYRERPNLLGLRRGEKAYAEHLIKWMEGFEEARTRSEVAALGTVRRALGAMKVVAYRFDAEGNPVIHEVPDHAVRMKAAGVILRRIERERDVVASRAPAALPGVVQEGLEADAASDPNLLARDSMMAALRGDLGPAIQLQTAFKIASSDQLQTYLGVAATDATLEEAFAIMAQSKAQLEGMPDVPLALRMRDAGIPIEKIAQVMGDAVTAETVRFYLRREDAKKGLVIDLQSNGGAG